MKTLNSGSISPDLGKYTKYMYHVPTDELILQDLSLDAQAHPPSMSSPRWASPLPPTSPIPLSPFPRLIGRHAAEFLGPNVFALLPFLLISLLHSIQQHTLDFHVWIVAWKVTTEKEQWERPVYENHWDSRDNPKKQTSLFSHYSESNTVDVGWIVQLLTPDSNRACFLPTSPAPVNTANVCISFWMGSKFICKALQKTYNNKQSSKTDIHRERRSKYSHIPVKCV